MTTISQVIVYLYAETAATIQRLKMEAYKSTTLEKFAFHAPDGKTFRTKRPDQQQMDAGWTYGKVKFQRLESYMSPRHECWQQYQIAKRQATLLLAARLILKANDGIVPEKDQVGAFLGMKIFRSHARTASQQKLLAYSSYRRLRKLDNRLRNQPPRFVEVEKCIEERSERRISNV